MIRTELVKKIGKIDDSEILEPHFQDETSKIHNWRNYVPISAKELWECLSYDCKVFVYYMAMEQANNEIWD